MGRISGAWVRVGFSLGPIGQLLSSGLRGSGHSLGISVRKPAEHWESVVSPTIPGSSIRTDVRTVPESGANLIGKTTSGVRTSPCYYSPLLQLPLHPRGPSPSHLWNPADPGKIPSAFCKGQLTATGGFFDEFEVVFNGTASVDHWDQNLILPPGSTLVFTDQAMFFWDRKHHFLTNFLQLPPRTPLIVEKYA